MRSLRIPLLIVARVTPPCLLRFTAVRSLDPGVLPGLPDFQAGPRHLPCSSAAAVYCGGCPNFGWMMGHSLAILLTIFLGPRIKQLAPLVKAAPLVSQENTLLN